jgi:hypothetical protein
LIKQAPSATEQELKQGVLEERWRKKLLALSWKMEGQLKWGKVPRDVSMSKRDIYLALNGRRNQGAFNATWKYSEAYFQRVMVERGNHRLFPEYLPIGTVPVQPGQPHAYLYQ